MKLSKNQREIVERMRDGYLLKYNGITHHYWLTKSGFRSQDQNITNVHKSTIKALNRRGLLKQIFYDFPVRKYTLTVKGKINQIQD